MRLAKSFLWSLLGTVSSRALVLFSMIVVARILGQSSFGELGIIQSTLGVAGLFAGIGLGTTATRFVAQHASNNLERTGRVVALVLICSIASTLITTGALFFSSEFIASEILDAPHLYTILVWGAVLMAASSFRNIQNGLLAGFEKFDAIAKLNILEGLSTLAAITILTNYFGLLGAIWGLTFGSTVTWLIGLILLTSELRFRKIKLIVTGCTSEWPILTGFSLPSGLSNLVATPVLWYCMVTVIQTEQGFEGIGLYNAAYQWQGPMLFLPMILMSACLPILVQEWEAGRTESFRKVISNVANLTLLLYTPTVIIAVLFSPWIMSLYGDSFSQSWHILALLFAAVPFHALSKIANAGLLAINRVWWVLYANVFWGGGVLLITLWLVPTMGVTGLAIAFLTMYSILGLLMSGLVLIGIRLTNTSSNEK